MGTEKLGDFRAGRRGHRLELCFQFSEKQTKAFKSY